MSLPVRQAVFSPGPPPTEMQSNHIPSANPSESNIPSANPSESQEPSQTPSASCLAPFKGPCTIGAQCCSGACQPTTSPDNPGNCHPYVTIFAPHTKAELQTQLFSLFEGEERKKMEGQYEKDLKLSTRRSTCENPFSMHHGKTVTLQECSDLSMYLPHNETHKDAAYMNIDESQKGPWTSPDPRYGKMLAPNPGIWAFEDFLNESEVEKVLLLVKKYGYDLGMLGACRDEKADSINAHPGGDGKTCFKMSADSVCKAPYITKKCPIKPDVEDAEFIAILKKRVQNFWQTDSPTGPYAKFQVTTGGTSPMHLHYDERTISFLVYLSDGGASTIFTNARVKITPKRGRAYSWLNYDENGLRNRMADHAIQAQPHNSEDRVVLSFVIRTPPQEFLESQRTYLAEA